MQVSDLTMHYNNHTTSSAENMNGTKGVERLVSAVREMAAGNIFEGTVNSLKNGQVVLGLSNGNELLAKLDANIQLSVGQSMFFQVKSNDGNTIAIRPYTIDGAGANLTLVNALKAANLPITDKLLTMANSMMEEQLPIDKNSLSQMARVLMANPDMSVNTLVQMKKLEIPLTQEMIAQFENYMDDKSAVHSAIDRFIDQLPQALTNDSLTGEQLKAFDSQFLAVLVEGIDTPEAGNAGSSSVNAQTGDVASSVINAQAAQVNPANDNAQAVEVNPVNGNDQAVEVNLATGNVQEEINSATGNAQINTQSEKASDVLGGISHAQAETATTEEAKAFTQAQDSFAKLNASQKETLLHTIKQYVGDMDISKEDTAATLLSKLSQQLLSGEHLSKANVQELFANKHVQSFLKDVLEQQLLLNPKEVLEQDKVQKLYQKLEGKMERLESLMQNAGIKDTPIAQILSDIRGNIEFMNQVNQAYTYIQIPLKMSNQNATAQLYVYTNKRDLEDPERDLTAFLHLDLEHLGATDISVRMHRKEVSTKFYMDNDAAYDLIESHMSILEERLRAKGYSCKIEVLNEGKKVNFVEDFLKKDAPVAGQLHRYSFDVRA